MMRRLKPIGFPGYCSAPTSSAATCSTRLIYGGRLSLLIGVMPVLLRAAGRSAFWASSPGIVGGWVNTLIMRVIDVFYAFPSVLLAIAISGALGAGIHNAILSLTIVFIPPIARVSESVTTRSATCDYVEAARASGAGAFRIMRVHVLSNVLGPIFVYATSLISVCIILAAGPVVPRPRRQPPSPNGG